MLGIQIEGSLPKWPTTNLPVNRSKTLLGFQDGESVPVREVSGFHNDEDWGGVSQETLLGLQDWL